VPIPIRYPIVETLTAFVFAVTGLVVSHLALLVPLLCIGAIAISVAFIRADHLAIPQSLLVVCAIAVGSIVGICLGTGLKSFVLWALVCGPSSFCFSAFGSKEGRWQRATEAGLIAFGLAWMWGFAGVIYLASTMAHLFFRSLKRAEVAKSIDAAPRTFLRAGSIPCTAVFAFLDGAAVVVLAVLCAHAG
jgi:prepilin signal peptidase PulO-like enzyme (type II secretory pathway)